MTVPQSLKDKFRKAFCKQQPAGDEAVDALAERAFDDEPPWTEEATPDAVPYVVRESVVVTFPGMKPVASSPEFISWWEAHNAAVMERHRKRQEAAEAREEGGPRRKPRQKAIADDDTASNL